MTIDIGAESRGRVDGLPPVGRLADDLDAILVGEDHAKAGPHELLIVDEEDPDAHDAGTASSTGRCAVTRNPVGVGCAANVPRKHRDALPHPDQPAAFMGCLHGRCRSWTALIVDRDVEAAPARTAR